MFLPEEQLDFDESMVAYFGRHNCKQFIWGKPIRFGYKVWCLNISNGYLVNFEVNQGRNPNNVDEYETKFDKATAPLVQMLDQLPENKINLPYKLYFDNLFTGMHLLNHLGERGYGATGTFRKNRIAKECPLPSSKEI